MPQRNSKRQKKAFFLNNINLKSHLGIAVAKLFDYQPSGVCKETREGWPLLTIKNEMNARLREYKWKGYFVA
jgi:hypothetical protein